MAGVKVDQKGEAESSECKKIKYKKKQRDSWVKEGALWL